ncbi:MAG: cellulase family glycosylhydrolase [Ignavibacteria bacterium]|nr:cellulase family glycosylhydrolase [Ignavibacteria bacterium]
MTGCSSLFFQKYETNFVKVKNERFEIGGTPYYFLGTNLWYGCYIGSKGAIGQRDRLKRELDLLKSLNINNLRILAASEESAIKNSVKPAIQSEPGKYNEELLDGLDFLLNEMRERNMHAVVYLNNYWEWSGGMAQYNAWFSGKKIADPEDPEFGWGGFMDYSAEFYGNEKANEHFKNFISKIVTRKNKYSGLNYYEDPTIMAWQLANEPRPGREGNAEKHLEPFYKWIEETAKYIHSIDTNHLVTTGNEGLMGSLQSEEVYLTGHKTKYIDYITCHLWPKNWSWFDAKRIEETYPSTVEKATNYVNQHINFARQLQKPLVMEEFGLSRDNELIADTTATTTRDNYFNTIFSLVYDSSAANAPISGTNFWAWGGEGRGKNPDGKWKPGDPFVGDPPQEPQGFNSVFNTDTTTLNIISKYAKMMKDLCVPGNKQISSK